MQSIQHLTAQVLSGGRIEIASPELKEGQTVDITIVPRPAVAVPAPTSLIDFFDSLPPGPRSAPTWEEFELQFQAERDAWDR
jgi:hypothetical protein